MPLFEVMTGISVTLAIAIPTFMEKVMRPRYEERFSEFTRARREVFFDEFETAFAKLKQSREEMTPDLIDTMESLFNEWGQVRTDETRLTTLLSYRKFFFVGWLLSCVLSLFSIQYSEAVVPYTVRTLGESTMAFFIIMFLATMWYGWQLFKLDEKLSKFKAKTTGETFGMVEPISVTIATGRQEEHKVAEFLKKLEIPFEQDTAIKVNEQTTYVDFAIPNAKKPKYIIELKMRLIRSRMIVSSLQYRKIKSHTKAKTILISNLARAPKDVLRIVKRYWDYVIDLRDLEKIKDIIKL